MTEFMIDDYLVIFPLYVLGIPTFASQPDEDSVIRAVGTMVATEDDDRAMLVFTEYDLAYDFMAAAFPSSREMIVVMCSEVDGLWEMIRVAKSAQMKSLVFDPLPPPSTAQSVFWNLDSILEASGATEEEEDTEPEYGDGLE